MEEEHQAPRMNLGKETEELAVKIEMLDLDDSDWIGLGSELA